jgi:hypothetical protein
MPAGKITGVYALPFHVGTELTCGGVEAIGNP